MIGKQKSKQKKQTDLRIRQITMKKCLIIACAFLTMLCISFFSELIKVREDRDRLQQNQSALLEDVTYYKTEAGKSAASVVMLRLTKDELEAHNRELATTVENLSIKLKRVQEATTTATKTKIEVRTVIKDSIIYKPPPGRIERMSTFNWQDPWVNVNGVIMPDSTIDLSVQSSDTLYQIVHRVPKRFLFFKYGTKAIRQEITSSNPHTNIVYTEYITVSE